MFCAKESDASCPQCEEAFDDLENDIATKTMWRTSDDTLHDTEEEAHAWIDGEADRLVSHRANWERNEEMLDEYRRESEERKARMRAVVPRIRERLGIELPWAHEGWSSWAESMSVYISGRDIVAMAGLDPSKRPETDEDFDAIVAGLREREIYVLGADEYPFGWAMRQRSGSLFSEYTYFDERPCTSSMDTIEFLAAMERLEPGITQP